MSGRLIILPKKSWHVWRQDNLERVIRDERLAAEAKEKEDIKERDAETEKRIELISKRKRQDNAGTRKVIEEKKFGGVNQGWGLDGEHVNLFPNFEEKSGKNVEYMREREQEELLKQKREGVAPLKFGGNSTDACMPWYTRSVPLSGSQVLNVKEQLLPSGTTVKLGMSREEVRKQKLDPLANLVKMPSLSKDKAENSTLECNPELNERSQKRDKKSKKKKRKDDSVHKSKKEKKKKDLKDGRYEGSESIEVLRKRRLEREREASQMAVQIQRQGSGQAVAPKDTPLPNERNDRYHSQYNPSVAKQNIHNAYRC